MRHQGFFVILSVLFATLVGSLQSWNQIKMLDMFRGQSKSQSRLYKFNTLTIIHLNQLSRTSNKGL
jgi:hypothetical protein